MQCRKKICYPFVVFAILFSFINSACNNNFHHSITNKQSWSLVWSDEFNYNGLPDSMKWNYEVGGNGWGNNEQQYYTNRDTQNAKVENGVLQIIARKQNKENRNYTSARLITKDKADFKYGKIEIKAKLAGGKGAWPAIWMLGKNIKEAGWPACGEIDITEHVGYMPDSVFASIHTADYNHLKGTQKVGSLFIKNPYQDFHLFAIEWTPEKIVFFMDGVLYNHFENEHLSVNKWPFSQPQYLIMNVAIGGNWGGKFGIDENIFPSKMEVDYVRVFKNDMY